MKAATNNHLFQQPSFGRDLLRKIDRHTDTPIAHNSFKEFIDPHLKYIDAICEHLVKPYKRYYSSHIIEEFYNQLLVAIYRNPKKLLQAVKSVKDPERFEEELHLAIALIGKEVLIDEILKDEKAYKRIVGPINNSEDHDLITDKHSLQEYEAEEALNSAEEDMLDDTEENPITAVQETVYDPDEKLVVKTKEMEFFEKVLATMRERDRLILIEIMPYLEKGGHLPLEVREKIMNQHELSKGNFNRLLGRIKKRFVKIGLKLK
jgi:hypothetical protein